MVGRVSMDLFAVDVTDLPSGQVRRDDWAVLIGPGLTLDEVAAQAGTISYEILTKSEAAATTGSGRSDRARRPGCVPCARPAAIPNFVRGMVSIRASAAPDPSG